jgi:transcriptional regulator with XRE-family HTH domain
MAATSWDEIKRRKIPPGQEAAQAASSRALSDALALRELRTSRGVTQVELAERLGKSQGNISELERRDDVYLSSLREYVEALGGRLEIAAVFEEETHLIDLMAALQASVDAATKMSIDRPAAAARPRSRRSA